MDIKLFRKKVDPNNLQEVEAVHEMRAQIEARIQRIAQHPDVEALVQLLKEKEQMMMESALKNRKTRIDNDKQYQYFLGRFDELGELISALEAYLPSATPAQ